jgi:VWFA-related protein
VLWSLLILLLWPAFCLGQTAPSIGPSNNTIRVTTRLVYVDVVVRDAGGQFVHGLNQPDFKLFEDGHAQQIGFFSEHRYGIAAAASHVPAGSSTPKLEFSNVPTQALSSGSLNIILFDLVNTPSADQIDARRQLLKFLQALPPGQKCALFILSDRLHIVQNFTDDSSRLAEAARQLDPKDFHLLRSQAQVLTDNDFLADFAQAMGHDPGGLITHLKQDQTHEDNINQDIAARITIAALAELARATSGYPGRKNLLWLSESFPLVVGEQMRETRFEPSAYLPGARETANLIASAQIAVYPISLRSLEVGGVPVTSSGTGEVSGLGGPQTNNVFRDQFYSRQDLRTIMDDIAVQTGGEAFVGTNDFAEALHRSMDDGSNYYTLAYTPQNRHWDGKFRKIRLELGQKGYSLTYRRGYFASPDALPSTSNLPELNAAMQPGTLESTVLPLKSKIQLPDAQHSTTRIDSILDPGNVQFDTDSNGRRRARLLVLLVALTDGPEQPAAPPQTSGVLVVDLDADHFKALLGTGIPFHQELALKPGRYRLRLGVSDLNNHRLGTLDMPIAIAANNSPEGSTTPTKP